jgi:hypothetical protein
LSERRIAKAAAACSAVGTTNDAWHLGQVTWLPALRLLMLSIWRQAVQANWTGMEDEKELEW